MFPDAAIIKTQMDAAFSCAGRTPMSASGATSKAIHSVRSGSAQRWSRSALLAAPKPNKTQKAQTKTRSQSAIPNQGLTKFDVWRACRSIASGAGLPPKVFLRCNALSPRPPAENTCTALVYTIETLELLAAGGLRRLVCAMNAAGGGSPAQPSEAQRPAPSHPVIHQVATVRRASNTGNLCSHIGFLPNPALLRSTLAHS